MLTLRLAWRSFFRHRRRSIVSGAAIALGLAMLLVFVGLSIDAHARMIDLGVHLGSGHVLVQGAGYQEDPSLDHVVTDPGAVVAAARGVQGVKEVALRLRGGGLLTAGARSCAVAVAGVDPAREPRVSTIASAEHLVAGEGLDPAGRPPGEPSDLVLGRDLARKLAVGAGDRVVLTVSPRGGGDPAAAAFVVRGVFATGVAELDGFYVEVPLDQAQALFHTGGAVTQVALLLGDPDQAERVTAALARRLPPSLEVVPWMVALHELREAVVLDDASMYLMLAIVFVIVSLGIFNTLLMSVVERTREYGVMMAIGTSARRLFAGVVAEALVLGVVGTAAGLAIGLSLHCWLATHGLDLTRLYGGGVQMSGIVIAGRVYSRLPFWVVVKWTIAVIGLVVAAAGIPAWRASRLVPVEAMRHA